jgi:hypothetical protein
MSDTTNVGDAVLAHSLSLPSQRTYCQRVDAGLEAVAGHEVSVRRSLLGGPRDRSR